MKKTIKEFFAKCGSLLQQEQNKADVSAQAALEESYNNSLKYIEKCRASMAADYAYEWESHKARNRELEIEGTLEKQRIVNRNSIPHEMDRRQRAERLIELGKSYSPPAAERCPERDAPDLEPN